MKILQFGMTMKQYLQHNKRSCNMNIIRFLINVLTYLQLLQASIVGGMQALPSRIVVGEHSRNLPPEPRGRGGGTGLLVGDQGRIV